MREKKLGKVKRVASPSPLSPSAASRPRDISAVDALPSFRRARVGRRALLALALVVNLLIRRPRPPTSTTPSHDWPSSKEADTPRVRPRAPIPVHNRSRRRARPLQSLAHDLLVRSHSRSVRRPRRVRARNVCVDASERGIYCCGERRDAIQEAGQIRRLQITPRRR